jgi:hypothetical protein
MTALLLTLLSFGIILLLCRLKAPLSLAILGGAFALGAFFGQGGLDLLRVSARAVTRGMSLGLLLTMFLLMALSEAMARTGRLERMVTLVNTFFRRPAITLAVLPALIGLLPVPGGALLSAPMVRQAVGTGRDPGGDMLSTVNYWWRHIWEHWWPLYPGVILAMSLTRSSLWTFVVFQAPLGCFMALGGLLILRRLHPELHQVAPPPPPGTLRAIARAMAPIGIILLVWFAGDLGFKGVFMRGGDAVSPAIQWAGQFGPLIAGLVASLVFTLVSTPLPAGRLRPIVVSRTMAPLLGLVLSVMIYQQVLVEVKAAERISVELSRLHVPVLLVVVVLPFLAGLLTGVAFGFVGVSFPLVLSLVAAMPGEPAMRPYAVLAYACGHLGMMISPIHLCYVVSNRYFATTYGATMRLAWGACALVAGLAAAYFAVLKWLL